MKVFKMFGIFLLIIILSGCAVNKEDIDELPDTDIANEIHDKGKGEDKEPSMDYIEEQVNAMTLEEKIGQLLIVGFEGEMMNEQIKGYIHELNIGGFILFARNIKDEIQVLDLLNKIKEENSNLKIPLFLSIDEEGGKVSRLPNSFIKLPDAMAFGDKNNKDISYEFGRIIGERVKLLGFNMNFAPVLDINSNPNNPVIGTRAFGTTISQVVDNGLEVMKGIRNTGIIPAVKHFPGHGDTDVDSHVNLPTIDKNLEELELLELIPFEEAINDKVEMIMTAHILYPKIDEKYPATMSEKIIGELLRGKFEYNGVIISDDMTMNAIVNSYTLEEGVISFLKSGGDIALICHGEDNPSKAVDRIIQGIDSGEISEDEINQKVYRILALKEKYELKDAMTENIELNDLNNRTKAIIKRIKD